MKTYGLMVVAAVVCLAFVAYGQAVPGADPPAAAPAAPAAGVTPGGTDVPGAGPAPALPPKVMQYKNAFMKTGIPDEEATLLAVIMAGDIDPMKLMMLMGMKGGGGMDGDAMGMLMFSQVLGGGKGGQGTWFRDGEWMYVLDDSVLYKLNFETMQVDGKLPYKEDIEAEAMTMGMLVKAMMKGGKGGPGPAAHAKRSAQLKQLGLAMHMLLADMDGQLPGEDWVAAIVPYIGDKSVLKCPAWPEAPVGYAMNDKLIDAKLPAIKEPGRIVLFFETQVGGESPVGNAADVPMDPIMGQRTVCAVFVDGHVEMVDAAELQRRLQMNPFGE